MRRLTLSLFAVAALAGCETQTPYAPAGGSGYGFSDQRIERDRYRITFSGNSLTERQTVETYLLFRAAELAIQNGYDYFILVENDTEATSTFRATGAPYGPRFGPGGPFFRGYYAYGWGWADPFYDATIREQRRYSATAYVKFGRGEKPEDDPLAYDARQVMDNLRATIVRPQQ